MSEEKESRAEWYKKVNNIWKRNQELYSDDVVIIVETSESPEDWDGFDLEEEAARDEYNMFNMFDV